MAETTYIITRRSKFSKFMEFDLLPTCTSKKITVKISTLLPVRRLVPEASVLATKFQFNFEFDFNIILLFKLID